MRALVQKPLISLVVPFYNEGEAVERFFDVVIPVMVAIDSIRFEIVCINDGSRDDTLDRLIAIGATDTRVRVIDLTRNFGKEAALTAGIDEATGDAVIPLDADLQDPPSLIPVMIEHWRDGAEVVAAKRTNRACDSFAKRTAAALYYRVHNALSEVKLPENVGDFRLMDRQVVNALRALPERRRFMKGLFAWVGYRTVIVEYQRDPRSAGHSKFSGWKLWNFALEGITSFSTVPLRSWTYIGLGIAALAFGYGAYIIGRTLAFGNPVPGYASLISVVLFIGGIELVGIGVIGEYIGRIYYESKERPVYLVRRRYQARSKVSTLPVSRDSLRQAAAAARADLARRRTLARHHRVAAR
ncbi:glycosyltransferase family 2 protein [Burkholderia sp. Ac-20353]|uniref:glycosyltransferase family 2 protein n=1 Tax=Burkholderia sp. Ac-20353 TaxID=2703894 RepID=UPI00197C26D2|nr:glycosyltransferase family 2 protein [Burkholderia sp. Ac-20353]MBN3791645.1 glycosyltransferase family 2 protein [Burkholderia sp. Ac-20353]